jgi:hypothetical protein
MRDLDVISIDSTKSSNNMLEDLGKFVVGAFKNVYKDIKNDIISSGKKIKDEIEKSNDNNSKEIKDSLKSSNDSLSNKIEKESNSINTTSVKTTDVLKGKLIKINTKFQASANRGDKIINDIFEQNALIREKFFKMSQDIAKKFSNLKGSLLSMFNSIRQVSISGILGGILKSIGSLLMSPATWSAIGGILLTSIGLNPSMLLKWGSVIKSISGSILDFTKSKLGDKVLRIKTLINDVILKVSDFISNGLSSFSNKVKSLSTSIKESSILSKTGSVLSKVSKVGVVSKGISVAKGTIDVVSSLVNRLGKLVKGGGGVLASLVKPIAPLFTRLIGKIPVFGNVMQIGMSLWEGYKAVFGEGSNVKSTLGEKIWTFTKVSLGSFLKSFTDIPSAIGDVFGFIFGKDHPVAKVMTKIGDFLSNSLGNVVDGIFTSLENLFNMGKSVSGVVASIFNGDWEGVKSHFGKFFSLGLDQLKLTLNTIIFTPIKEFFNMFDIDIVKSAKGVFNNITTWFSNTWTDITSKVVDIKNSILNFINPMMDRISEVGGMFSTVITDLKTSIIGMFIDISNQQWYKDYIQPIIDVVSPVINTIYDKIKPVISVFENIINNGKGIISSIFNGDINGVLSHGSDLFKSYISMPLDILKSISSIFGVDITKQQWFKDYIVSPLSSIGDWVTDKITVLKDSILLLLNKTIPDSVKVFLPTSLKESIDSAIDRNQKRMEQDIPSSVKMENLKKDTIELENQLNILREQRKSATDDGFKLFGTRQTKEEKQSEIDIQIKNILKNVEDNKTEFFKLKEEVSKVDSIDNTNNVTYPIVKPIETTIVKPIEKETIVKPVETTIVKPIEKETIVKPIETTIVKPIEKETIVKPIETTIVKPMEKETIVKEDPFMFKRSKSFRSKDSELSYIEQTLKNLDREEQNKEVISDIVPKPIEIKMPYAKMREGGITTSEEKEIPAILHKNEAVVSDLDSPRGDEWVDKICDKLVDKMKYNLEELDSSEGISLVLSLLQNVISGQNNIQGLISSINNKKDDVYNSSKHFHSMSNSIIGL